MPVDLNLAAAFVREQEQCFLVGQRADGSWESEDGPDRDPYVTVEALRGLLMWAAL